SECGELLVLPYFQTGRLREAQERLASAVKRNPERGDFHYDLALVQLEQQNYSDAAQELDAAIRLKSGSPLSHLLLGRAYQNTNRTVQAIEEFRAAVRLDPHLPLGHYHLGFAYQSLGRNQEALNEYKQELNIGEAT